jgi:hypothetical protein
MRDSMHIRAIVCSPFELRIVTCARLHASAKYVPTKKGVILSCVGCIFFGHNFFVSSLLVKMMLHDKLFYDQYDAKRQYLYFSICASMLRAYAREFIHIRARACCLLGSALRKPYARVHTYTRACLLLALCDLSRAYAREFMHIRARAYCLLGSTLSRAYARVHTYARASCCSLCSALRKPYARSFESRIVRIQVWSHFSDKLF